MEVAPVSLDNGQLSDREWRQMRRSLPALAFEPVPETPPLVPRSYYCESGGERSAGDDATAMEELEKRRAQFGKAESAKDEREDDGEGSADSPETEEPAMKMSPCPEMVDKGRMQALGLGSEVVGGTVSCSNNHNVVAATSASELEKQMSDAQSIIRRVVMTTFADFQAQFAQSSDLERKKLRAAHANDVMMFQAKIEELKEKLVRSQQREQRASEWTERYSSFVLQRELRERSGRENHAVLSMYFHQWVELQRARCGELMKTHVALKWRRRRLLQRPFSAWTRETRTMRENAMLRTTMEKHALQDEALHNEYELKMQELEKQLEEAREQVTIAQRQRQKLEDDLRKVFLRGVSAMNIEALTLFNGTQRKEEMGTASDRDGYAPMKNAADVLIQRATQEQSEGKEEEQGKHEDERRNEPQPSPPPSASDDQEESDLDMDEADELDPPERSPPPRKPTTNENLHEKLQHLLQGASRPRIPPPQPLSPTPRATSASTCKSHNARSPARVTPMAPHGAKVNTTGHVVDARRSVSSPLKSAKMVDAYAMPMRSSPLASHANDSVDLYDRWHRASGSSRRGRTSGSSHQQAVELEYMRSSMTLGVGLNSVSTPPRTHMPMKRSASSGPRAVSRRR